MVDRNQDDHQQGESGTNDHDISGPSPSSRRGGFSSPQSGEQPPEGPGGAGADSDSAVPATKSDADVEPAGGEDHPGGHLDQGQVELAHIIAEIVESRLLSSSYSGPIPDPQQLYGYNEADRERIFRMSEAHTTDESARRDRIVGAMVRESVSGQWFFAVLFTLMIVAAMLAMWFFQNPWFAGLFVAGSLVSALPGLLGSSSRARKSRGSSEVEPRD